jgi:hypothetical protein
MPENKQVQVDFLLGAVELRNNERRIVAASDVSVQRIRSELLSG